MKKRRKVTILRATVVSISPAPLILVLKIMVLRLPLMLIASLHWIHACFDEGRGSVRTLNIEASPKA